VVWGGVGLARYATNPDDTVFCIAVLSALQFVLHCSFFFCIAAFSALQFLFASQRWAELVGCVFLAFNLSLSLSFDIAGVVWGGLGWFGVGFLRMLLTTTRFLLHCYFFLHCSCFCIAVFALQLFCCISTLGRAGWLCFPCF
jgi:hypothetical protein